MKKKYDSTIEEAIEASFRLAEVLGTLKKIMWFGLAWVPLIWFLIFIIYPRPSMEKWMVCIIFTVLFIPIHMFTYKNLFRRMSRRFIIKSLGTDQPVPTEYELTGEHLIFRQQGRELRLSWPNVKKFTETAEAIEIITQPPGIALIPKRIFQNQEEVRQWISFIQNHMEK